MVSSRAPGWAMPESSWRRLSRHKPTVSVPRVRARKRRVRGSLFAGELDPPDGPGESDDGKHGPEPRRDPPSPTEDRGAGKPTDWGHNRADQARPRCSAAIQMSISDRRHWAAAVRPTTRGRARPTVRDRDDPGYAARPLELARRARHAIAGPRLRETSCGPGGCGHDEPPIRQTGTAQIPKLSLSVWIET